VISDAVVLMAGSGSRLRIAGRTPLKPLVPLLGRPLISYTLEALCGVGITTVHAVVGFEAETLRRELPALAPDELTLHFVENPDWRKQNGVSVLAAAPHVRAPFLLTMSDHLFDPVILDLLVRSGPPERLHLAVDRKLASIFDPDDAMKVQTRGDEIVTLGKELHQYDAIDTGLFLCAADLFDHLAQVQCVMGDCSLADGVRSLGALGLARAVDIGAAWWQDVDTPEMFAVAEAHLRARAEARRDMQKQRR
jgi:1L-myo-inositol 1-phosphate cytidylyltransferase